MLTRNKPKNRRIEHKNVLEVKMHSQYLRAVRLRVVSRLTLWLLTSGLVIGLAWYGSEWALERFVYRNTTFAVREIDVLTDGILPLDRLRQWTGVRPGDNLFAVDLQRVKRDLKLNTLIRDAAVDRILPNTLWVRIAEREPIAQFTAWQQPSVNAGWRPVTYYLDVEGYLLLASDLPKLSQEQTKYLEYLPKLNGVVLTELTKGKAIESPRIRAALRLITAFQQSPMAERADLEVIDVSTAQVLEVTTRQNGKIVLGFEDIGEQLRRWDAVQDFAARSSRAISLLDLSVSNNVPALWQEASFGTSVQPRAAKPPRYRKKNV